MIGGEFELGSRLLAAAAHTIDPRTAFASGRGALHAIVRDAIGRHGVESVLLPDYVCESMISAVSDAGARVGYYPVCGDLRPNVATIVSSLLENDRRQAVVVIDYFGITSPLGTIAALRDSHLSPVIIIDLAHAALRFRLPEGADYAFTTFRKSLPPPDGAPVLSQYGSLSPRSDREAPFVAEKLAGNTLKARAISERLNDEAYLSHTRLGERLLDEDTFYDYRMSDTGATVYANLDLREIAARRRHNFETLSTLIAEFGLEPLRALEPLAAPHFLPVLLQDRDRVRSQLAEQGIFCPVHWPWPGRVDCPPPNPDAPLWRNELSLVIDHRYSDNDMYRLADALGDALGRG